MNDRTLFTFAAGVFVIVAAIKDFDFFMNHRKSQKIVKLFGRKGARIFYGVLGVVIIALGMIASIYDKK